MCGRYALITPLEELSAALKAAEIPVSLPNYNVSPGQHMPVLVWQKGRQLRKMKWGLVPNWSPTNVSKGNTINAQQEGLAIKPTFKHLIQNHRCVVPISAFYEWQLKGNIKQPYAIRPLAPLGFLAGLWDHWVSSTTDETLDSFTIITTPSDGLMLPLHSRQPVVLPEDMLDYWLNPENNWLKMDTLLQSYAWPSWESYPVSTLVNSNKYNKATMLQKAMPIPQQGSLF
jgi:putative SOS response-associated peptidase YedK